jgi:anti-sigma B factor antagonist
MAPARWFHPAHNGYAESMRDRRPQRPQSEQPVLDIEIRAEDGSVVVAVAGEVDEVTAPSLRAALADAFVWAALKRATLKRGGGVVVADLTEVTFLGTAGLSALVGAACEAERRSGPLRVVVDETRPVIRPIQITGLDVILTLYHDLVDALDVGE